MVSNSDSTLVFGILPQKLAEDLKHVDWKIRCPAVVELDNLLSKEDAVESLLPHLESFTELLIRLLFDTNFKIIVTTLHIVQTILPETAKNLVPQFSELIPALVEKLGDSKVVIRQAARDLLVQLIDLLGVDAVFSVLVSEKCFCSESKQLGTIREEIINIVIRTLLSFPDQNFNYQSVTKVLVEGLKDSRHKVKYSALEALAIINGKIPKQLPQMLMNQLNDELYAIALARFQRGRVPFLNSEGEVTFRPITHQIMDEKKDLLANQARRWSASTTKLDAMIPPLPEAEKSLSLSLAQEGGESPAAGVPSRPSVPPLFPSDSPDTKQFREGYSLQSSLSSSISSVEWEMIEGETARGSPRLKELAPDLPLKDPLMSLRTRSLSQAKMSPGINKKPPLPVSEVSTPQALQKSDDKLLPQNMLAPLDEKYANVGPVHSISPAKLEFLKRKSSSRFQTPIGSPMRPSTEVGRDREHPPAILEPLRKNLAEPLPELAKSPSVNSLLQNDKPPLQTTMTHPVLQPKNRGSAELKTSPVQSKEGSPTKVIEAEEVANNPRQKPPPPQDDQPVLHKMKEPVQIKSEDLEPSKSPDKEFKIAMENLKAPEWEQNFEAIDSIRRLSIHHCQVIVPQLHNVMLLILNCVENLRSGVARNAIACIGDMFGHLTRHTQTENVLSFVAPKLLRKYSETGKFLLEETDKTFMTIVDSLPPVKTLPHFLPYVKHKHAMVRNRCALFVALCVEHMSLTEANMRELEKVIPAISCFLQDGNGETRAHGRRGIWAVHNLLGSSMDTMEQLLFKLLPELQVKKILECIEKIAAGPADNNMMQTLKNTRRATLPISKKELEQLSVNSTGLSTKPPTPVKTAPVKREDRPKPSKAEVSNSNSPSPPPTLTAKQKEELENLPIILNAMNSNEWKAKSQAIQQLVMLVELCPSEAKAKVVKIFDSFTPRLCESNSKVCTFAMHAFLKMIPLLKDSLGLVFNTLLPTLAGNIASSKSEIRQAASEVFECLIDNVDNSLFVQQFASIVQNGNRKVQAPILELIATIIPEVAAKKPAFLTKYILPVSLNLLEDSKGEIKTANQSVLRALQNEIPLMESCAFLSDESKAKLMALLK